MLAIRNLRLPLCEGRALEEAVLAAVARRLVVPSEHIDSVQILKRSVDARKKADVHFVATLGVVLAASSPVSETEVAARLADTNVVVADKPVATAPPTLTSPPPVRPVVVGTGPAGLFAALTLARAGANPIVIERGRPVDERVRSWDMFVATGELDPESNIQFGEGGAGTFSDGKLNTNTKDARSRFVLEALAEAGAPEEILWQAKPHVGTDRLRGAVRQLRAEIERLGGEVRFLTRLDKLLIGDDGALAGIATVGPAGREEHAAEALVLATGHSARDTFEMLRHAGAHLVQKPFSIGVRIEHSQRLVDLAQYGPAADSPALGAAEYKLSEHIASGRAVYTFCMCPGGEVVASASEAGGVVTNGMSNFAREGENANSALLVSVFPMSAPPNRL